MNAKEERNKGQLMTEGPIGKQLILFALPLLMGNVFQQLYNTVDAMVVGRYVGENALAAVGSAGSVINLIVSMLMGITMGASVTISNHYGARDTYRLRRSIHTATVLAILCGVLLTVVGMVMSPFIVKWIGTPAEVIDESTAYLRIIFGGMLFSTLYNSGSSIFRAVGDSRRPLYYLIVSSVTNIVLDVLFVVNFRMGVEGAALATILSQLFSAVLTYGTLMRTDEEYRLSLKELCIDRRETGLIVKIGIPGGIQNSVIAFSNIVVQANINSFEANAMAGCAAWTKVDGFAIMPALSFSMALTTFIGQNMGAQKPERMKKGARFGILAAAITVQSLGVLLYFFCEPIIRLFNDNPEVIKYGVQMARILSPMYLFLAVSHAMAGVMRGAGLTKVPMYAMIGCWCLERVVWITFAVNFIAHDIRLVFLGYPITWITSTIAFLIYYYKTDWVNHSLEQS